MKRQNNKKNKRKNKWKNKRKNKRENKNNKLSHIQKYKKFFGHNANDMNVKRVSYNDQVDRIARAIYFFAATEPPQSDGLDNLVKNRDRMNDMMMCSRGRTEAFEKMEKWSKMEGFENLQRDVRIELKKLTSKPIPEWLLWDKNTPKHLNFGGIDEPSIDDIDDIEKKTKKKGVIRKMKEYADVSDKLYKKAQQELTEEDTDDILDPINWLGNQFAMRASWESYVSSIRDGKLPEFLKDQMLKNNPVSKYLKFMYDTYPAGYGDELIKRCNNNVGCDGAEIFMRLGGK